MEKNELYALKCAVENATIGLDELPALIQLLIEAYDLDKTDLTQEDRMNVALNANSIYIVLSIVQRTIKEANEKLTDIMLEKDLSASNDQQATEA